MKTYLSGPMTGYAEYNFPAFHAAADVLRTRHHHEVVNPADNFDGETHHPRGAYLREDLRQLVDCEAIVLLPGWRESRGACLELECAVECGMRVYQYDATTGDLIYLSVTEDHRAKVVTLEPEPLGTSAPLRAHQLIHGDRNDQYGHPLEDFTRSGRIIGAILGIPDVPAEKVALIMQAVKISRAVNEIDLDRPVKADTIDDGCGYWGTLEMVQERRKEQAREWSLAVA